MAKGNKKTEVKGEALNEEVKISSPDEIEELADEVEKSEEPKKVEEDEEIVNEDKPSAFDILILKEPTTKDYTGAIFVRQYSYKVHGKDFEELADEFCTKSPKGKNGMYVKIPTAKINKVEVRYREKADYDMHPDKQNPDAPIEDKVKVFSDKEEAVVFGSQKIQSTVVVSRRK